jgi:hypothetical protein
MTPFEISSTSVPAGWEVDEDDYGDPMVAHLHPWGSMPAYVINRSEGGYVAQCSACMAYLDLDRVEADSIAQSNR